jgi:hypothetical protein
MVENWHTSLSLQALVFFIEQTDETLVTELIALTPQERPRFLASIEYLAEEAKLNKRDPLVHTRASEQAIRLFNEQTDGILVVELLVLTPQERFRFLATITYL